MIDEAIADWESVRHLGTNVNDTKQIRSKSMGFPIKDSESQQQLHGADQYQNQVTTENGRFGKSSSPQNLQRPLLQLPSGFGNTGYRSVSSDTNLLSGGAGFRPAFNLGGSPTLTCPALRLSPPPRLGSSFGLTLGTSYHKQTSNHQENSPISSKFT